MKMKTSGFLLGLALLGLFIANTSPVASESTGMLIVNISGFPSSEGFAMVALHDSEESYKGEATAAIAKTQVKVVDQKAQAIFGNLAYGGYGVSIFHDENANGKMDKNAMGIPKEAYGFSNNAKGFFGKPDYAKVKFELNSPEKQIAISFD